MRDFILRIVSQWRGDGADQAKRATREVATEARQASREAEPGRFRRFFDGIRQGARRSAEAFAGLVRQARLFIGIGLAGAVALITRRMNRMSAETERNARVTGLSNEQWQRLNRTANALQVSASQLESALRSMNRRVSDNEEDFRAAGISVRDVNGEFRDSIDIFLEVADVVAGMSSAHDRAAVSQRLMGQSGQNILPVLRMGSTAIREQMESTRVMSDETIRSLQAAQQRWSDFLDDITIGTSRAIPWINQTIEAFQRLGGTPLTDVHQQQVSDFQAAIRDLGSELTDVLGRPIRGARLNREIDRIIRGEETMAISAREREEIEQRAVQIALERTRQQRDQAEDARREAEAAAEKAEREREQNRIAEARRVLQQGELERAQNQLSTQEVLAQMAERVADLKEKANAGDVSAALEINRLKAEEMTLREDIAAAAELERRNQQESTESLMEDLEIMRARAAGQEALADRLEYDRDLRRETRSIVEATGFSEDRARAKAAEMLNLQRQIAAAKRNSRQETEEETKEQRRLRELMDKAVADPFGRGLEGREAIRELQRGGHLDRNQRVVQETLLAEQARRQREGADGGAGVPALPPAAGHRPAEPAPAGDAGAADAARSGVREIQRSGAETSQAVERMGEATVAALRGVLEELGRVTNQLQTVSAQIKNQRN